MKSIVLHAVHAIALVSASALFPFGAEQLSSVESGSVAAPAGAVLADTSVNAAMYLGPTATLEI